MSAEIFDILLFIRFYRINESRCFFTWLLQITTPKVLQKCAETFLSSRELFFCRNLKNCRCHFWADVMLRQPRILISRASLAQKGQVWLKFQCSLHIYNILSPFAKIYFMTFYVMAFFCERKTLSCTLSCR